MSISQNANISVGLAHYEIGEIEKALKSLQDAVSPLSVIDILTWAALVAHAGDYEKACRILRTVPSVSKAKSEEEVLSILTCTLLEDVLMVIHRKRELVELKLRKRGRLLRIQYNLLLFPMMVIMDTISAALNLLGHSSAKVMKKLSSGFVDQCWISGVPVRPEFMGPERELSSMKGFESSNDVYHDIFYSYLDYWINRRQAIQDLLLVCIKPADAHALYSLVRQKSPSVLLEIGTFVGFSTSILAMALKENGRGEIHCVDPDLKHLSVDAPLDHAINMLKKLDLDEYVTFHKGFFSPPKEHNGTCEVLGNRAAEILPPIDFAFIDGDHSTSAVIQDFLLLLPCLGSKATVVFHDIKTWMSVRQGLQVLLSSDILEKYTVDCYMFTPSGFDGLGVMEVNRNY